MSAAVGELVQAWEFVSISPTTVWKRSWESWKLPELSSVPAGMATRFMQHQVDQGPAGIGGRVAHGPHPAPPQRHLEQRFLNQVLGVPVIR